jgi:hypothetical protein
MKKILFVCVALATLSVSCHKKCEVPDPVANCVPDLKKGLLAYYPFNGNANDESGNGNNGTPMNGAFFTTDMIGRPNKAAGFDGINDYIIVQDNGKLNSNELTASMMVYFNSINRRHTYLNRVNFSNASASIWGIGQSYAGTNSFDFAVSPASGDCNAPNNGSTDNLVSVTEVMQPNRWYHVLVTFGNGEQKLYVDGVFRSSKKREFNNLKNCTTANLLIGGWWQNDIISIDGKIDEVRIYNRVITTCEIEDLTRIFL